MSYNSEAVIFYSSFHNAVVYSTRLQTRSHVYDPVIILPFSDNVQISKRRRLSSQVPSDTADQGPMPIVTLSSFNRISSLGPDQLLDEYIAVCTIRNIDCRQRAVCYRCFHWIPVLYSYEMGNSVYHLSSRASLHSEALTFAKRAIINTSWTSNGSQSFSWHEEATCVSNMRYQIW